jgi:uncharacterized protein YjbJ (UPF0337 family)
VHFSANLPISVLFNPAARFRVAQQQEIDMDKDRIEGIAKQVKGSVKEAVGKVTGDTKTQAEGAAEKAAGKAQSTVGGAKDAIRDTFKK